MKHETPEAMGSASLTHPTLAIDAALYQAKKTGRDRVCLAIPASGKSVPAVE